MALILGDNIFYGQVFSEKLEDRPPGPPGRPCSLIWSKTPSGTAWSRSTRRQGHLPRREAASSPTSNYAVTGPLLLRQPGAGNRRQTANPPREGNLKSPTSTGHTSNSGSYTSSSLGRGFAWLDTGTETSLIQAGEFVRTVEERAGPENRLSGRDCLCQGVHHPGRPGKAGPAVQQQLWPVPYRPAGTPGGVMNTTHMVKYYPLSRVELHSQTQETYLEYQENREDFLPIR